MSATVVRPEVLTFVARVRSALDDLTPEEVEELVGGLEADLSDALDADGESPADRFGDPDAYAAELRSAAGLPPRAPRGPGGATPGRPRGLAGDLQLARDNVADAFAHFADPVRRQPWWPPVRDFLVTLRPAWWVLRAWVAYQVVNASVGVAYTGALPDDPAGWLLLLVAVVASVELGRRGMHRRGPGWRGLVIAGNVLAVLLLPVAMDQARISSVRQSVETYTVPPENGLWLDGREVRNVFPYDSQGRPLAGVQLYDENGRPLSVGESARTPIETSDAQNSEQPNGSVGQVPAVDSVGRVWWNVFPLRQQEQDPFSDTPATTEPYPAKPPAVLPPPLVAPDGPVPSPGSSAGASPSAGATPGGSPTGSAQASPSPSPGPSGSAQASPSPTGSPQPSPSP